MISIIIPVYNVERYISRCIDSILNQTYQNFEIIVIDDNSPDNSIKIVEDYVEKDSRIKVVYHKENMGLLWTRMTGYTNVRGDYLVFCDSDDYMPKDALEILYTKIQQEDADIVIGNYQVVDSKGIPGYQSTNVLKYGVNSTSVYKSLLKGETGHNLWGKIYNIRLFKGKDYIIHKNFINAEDGFLLYQIVANCNKVVTSQDIVYYYFHNEQSSSKSKYSENAIWSIVTFWNMLDKTFRNDDDLYKLTKRRNIKAYSFLLSLGYSPKVLFKYIDISNFKEYLKFRSLMKLFPILEVFRLYILTRYKQWNL